MQTLPNLLRDPHYAYRVFLPEKLIINFALPMDFVYHTLRAFIQKDLSQTHGQRLAGLWNGKVAKYQKLLRIKDELGQIPTDWKELCLQTPCGRTRFVLATLANPKRRRIAAQPSNTPVLESRARETPSPSLHP